MADDFEDKQEESFNLEQYAEVARRRMWYFLIPLFVGWLVVWAVSWVLPSVYRSGTLIIVEQPSVPTQYVVPNVTDNLQDRLQSITQQILSRTRILRIIESQNLYAESRQRQAPDELVDRMRKDIEIELVQSPGRQQLTAFNIYYSSRDPRVAQQVTSELTNLFISENLEARQQQSENTTQFLGVQLEEARRSLSEQEEKVRQFKDQHLGDLPGQLQSNLQILSGLQAQLGAAQDALNRAKQQNVYLESLLGQYRNVQRSPRTGDSVPMGLPAVDQELDRLKAQLADLSAHYTDRHPDVRKVKEQIAKTEKMKEQIRAGLKAKEADSQANGNSEATPRDAAEIRAMAPMVELESQLKANRTEISNRERAIQGLQSQIGEYEARLNREPVREQQLADLTRNYEQSRANYDSLLKKKNDSELATSLERTQQGEHFRILDPPSLPTKPYSPNRLKLSGMGLMLGILLGGVFAAGAEFIDDRLYDEKELKKMLPVVVISEIPDIVTAEEVSRQQKVVWLGRAAAGLVLASILLGTAISYLRG
jgi:polysaccharide chain length determinant protein (PEP-CTERM system associated)